MCPTSGVPTGVPVVGSQKRIVPSASRKPAVGNHEPGDDVVAAILAAAVCAHAGEVDAAPGLILVGGGVVLAGAAFALLMVVMRSLLRNATTLRRELDEVV